MKKRDKEDLNKSGKSTHPETACLSGCSAAGDNHKNAQEKIDYQMKLEKCLLETRAICHELSQPVTVISGYSEILLLNRTEDDPQYEKLFELKKQADIIDKIVRRLRYLVKYTTSDNSLGNQIIGGDD